MIYPSGECYRQCDNTCQKFIRLANNYKEATTVLLVWIDKVLKLLTNLYIHKELLELFLRNENKKCDHGFSTLIEMPCFIESE